MRPAIQAALRMTILAMPHMAHPRTSIRYRPTSTRRSIASQRD
jgi:hypothetical protein